MLSPKDMLRLEDEKYPESEIIDKIDSSIRSNFEMHPYQFASLNMVIPVRIRNIIAAKYARCGWKYVYHIAGEEKYSSFDRTFFYFSKDAIEDMDNCYLVQMSKVEYNKFVVYKENKLVEELDFDGE